MAHSILQLTARKSSHYGPPTAYEGSSRGSNRNPHGGSLDPFAISFNSADGTPVGANSLDFKAMS